MNYKRLSPQRNTRSATAGKTITDHKKLLLHPVFPKDTTQPPPITPGMNCGIEPQALPDVPGRVSVWCYTILSLTPSRIIIRCRRTPLGYDPWLLPDISGCIHSRSIVIDSHGRQAPGPLCILISRNSLIGLRDHLLRDHLL